MRLLCGKEVENGQKSSNAGLLHEKSSPAIRNFEISGLTRAIFQDFFSTLLGFHFYEATSGNISYVLVTRKNLRSTSAIKHVVQLTEYMVIDLDKKGEA